MAIISDPFGPVILTGNDAKEFLEQIEDERSGGAAQDLKEMYERGAKILKEMSQSGSARKTIKRMKAPAPCDRSPAGAETGTGSVRESTVTDEVGQAPIPTLAGREGGESA